MAVAALLLLQQLQLRPVRLRAWLGRTCIYTSLCGLLLSSCHLWPAAACCCKSNAAGRNPCNDSPTVTAVHALVPFPATQATAAQPLLPPPLPQGRPMRPRQVSSPAALTCNEVVVILDASYHSVTASCPKPRMSPTVVSYGNRVLLY